MNQRQTLSYFFVIILSLVYSILFGQSVQEMQKLKKEFEKLQQSQGQQLTVPTQVQNIDATTGLPVINVVTPYKGADTLSIKKLNKNFGYDFFTKRDSVKFWENLPTPAIYLLGPGDELVISIWGETQLRETFTVNREGKIYDAKVGLLNITGKTMDEARIYLKNQFARIYSTLKGRNPTTYMDVSLGKLKSINVNFVGQVNFPGVYPVHPFSTVITGLIQAGGVDTIGTLRYIEIKRDGELYNTIDLYDYFLKGEIPDKIQLRDQDIIVVPLRNSHVTIDNAVLRPGIFEAKAGEMVYDIIQYAGGLKPNASIKMVGIKRIKLPEKRNNYSSLENFYLDFEDTKDIEAQNGDHITVRQIFEEQNFVEIMGQVKVPGIYNYYDGMMLSDILKLGGVLKDTTFRKSVYLNKAEIIRRNPDSRYETIININLNEFINPEKSNDVFLQNNDRVIIHANLNYFEKEYIKIMGEVNIPGAYPLLGKSNEDLESMIKIAGGLTDKALKTGVSIYRSKRYFEEPPEDKILTQIQTVLPNSQSSQDKNKNKDKNKKRQDKIKLAWQGWGVPLMPGDSIIVKEKTGSVYVTGEVYGKGLIEFQRGKSVRYYIEAAGGINNYGDRNNVIIIYPNGITAPWRVFRTPKIIDGSTIVVYQKADMEPFDTTEFADTFASLVSSIVTILVLITSLNSNSGA